MSDIFGWTFWNFFLWLQMYFLSVRQNSCFFSIKFIFSFVFQFFQHLSRNSKFLRLKFRCSTFWPLRDFKGTNKSQNEPLCTSRTHDRYRSTRRIPGELALSRCGWPLSKYIVHPGILEIASNLAQFALPVKKSSERSRADILRIEFETRLVNWTFSENMENGFVLFGTPWFKFLDRPINARLSLRKWRKKCFGRSRYELREFLLCEKHTSRDL